MCGAPFIYVFTRPQFPEGWKEKKRRKKLINMDYLLWLWFNGSRFLHLFLCVRAQHIVLYDRFFRWFRLRPQLQFVPCGRPGFCNEIRLSCHVPSRCFHIHIPNAWISRGFRKEWEKREKSMKIHSLPRFAYAAAGPLYSYLSISSRPCLSLAQCFLIN